MLRILTKELWDRVAELFTTTWGLCELMRDEMETYKSTKFEMRQVEFIQGYNPREAIETIDYLNCINNKQLEELQLTRTQVIKIEKLIILNQTLYRVL